MKGDNYSYNYNYYYHNNEKMVRIQAEMALLSEKIEAGGPDLEANKKKLRDLKTEYFDLLNHINHPHNRRKIR